MSKWLDRLADLPKNRKATTPQLTRLSELNSVSAVSANLGEPQFSDPLSGGSKNEKYPPPQLTEPTKSDAASWRACHLRHVNRVRGRADYNTIEQAEVAFDRLLADWHHKHGETPPSDRCAGCDRPVAGNKVLALPDGAAVHGDRTICLTAYGRRWRSAAAEGLSRLGLVPPKGWSP